MFIAHRGIYNNIIKENTLESFILAIENPLYRGFELDIYTSLDGYFVVHHNPIINGKLIWKYNYNELKEKGIILLEDALNLNTNKIILIDIKDININIDKLTNLLNKYINKKIYVMSFFKSVINKFKNNNFKIGILNYILNSDPNYHYDFICLLYDVATDYIINSFKIINVSVFIYAINKNDKFIFKDVYYIIDDKILQEKK